MSARHAEPGAALAALTWLQDQPGALVVLPGIGLQQVPRRLWRRAYVRRDGVAFVREDLIAWVLSLRVAHRAPASAYPQEEDERGRARAR